jgi:predicted amidohydrolase YtcJ
MNFQNGHIVTMRGRDDAVTGMRIKGDRIAALEASAGGDEATIDLRGRTVIPGFCDAHTHFHYWATTQDHLELGGALSRAEAITLIGARAADLPGGVWIQGRGLNQNAWDPPVFPSRYDLDSVAPRNPAAIFSKDEHTYWVNSLALEKAGINRHTPDPEGGQILRDDSGKPTGILTELAYKMIEAIIPPSPPDQASDAMTRAADSLHRLGVTAVHDMGGWEAWEAYLRWSRSLDIVKYIPVEEAQRAVQAGLKSGDVDASLRLGGLKLFADGALGSQTAYLFEPYEGTSDNLGVSRITPAQFEEHLAFAEAHELACAIHAIGDRANSQVIDCALNHRAEILRHRVEHVQTIRPEDIKRMATSGWTASVQPSHIIPDRATAIRNLGEERSRNTYPFRSLMTAGVPLAFGSDCPIEPVDPLMGIYAACCRAHPTDSGGSWESAQCIDRYTALAAFTVGGAYAAGLAPGSGSLSPGMRANFVILDRDILTVPANEIPATRVLATFYAGRPRYVNESAAPDLAETLTPDTV